MGFRRALLAPVLIGLLSTIAAVAQVTTGTILGTVSDRSGAAIASAQITITEVNRVPNQNLNRSNPATSTAITSTVRDNRDTQAAIRVVF